MEDMAQEGMEANTARSTADHVPLDPRTTLQCLISCPVEYFAPVIPPCGSISRPKQGGSWEWEPGSRTDLRTGGEGYRLTSSKRGAVRAGRPGAMV